MSRAAGLLYFYLFLHQTSSICFPHLQNVLFQLKLNGGRGRNLTKSMVSYTGLYNKILMQSLKLP